MKPKVSSPDASETRQASLLELAADSASDGIVAIDEESLILFANPALTAMFGYSASELCGQPLTLLMPESLRDTHRASLGRYVATGQRHLSWKGVELPACTRAAGRSPWRSRSERSSRTAGICSWESCAT
jgi:PAS domain S-box-containing protein